MEDLNRQESAATVSSIKRDFSVFTDGMNSENRIISVVQVCKRTKDIRTGLTDSQSAKNAQAFANSLLASQVRASSVILHQEYAQRLHPAADGYPAACLPIANTPLVAYQIKYLEANN
jgi:hypothetical protein